MSVQVCTNARVDRLRRGGGFGRCLTGFLIRSSRFLGHSVELVVVAGLGCGAVLDVGDLVEPGIHGSAAADAAQRVLGEVADRAGLVFVGRDVLELVDLLEAVVGG